MTIRYFLHGDLMEDGRYFCARCDYGHDRDHFINDSDRGGLKAHYKRYLHSVDCYRQYQKRGHYMRPKEAYNLFTGVPQ